MKIGEISAGMLQKSAGMKNADNTNSTNSATIAKGAADVIITDTAVMEDYARDLGRHFPGAQIHIADLSGPGSIQAYAQAHYGSLQIVLSPKALKRMAEDPEFKRECERLMGDARKSLYDKAGRLTMAGNKVIGSGMVLDENGHVTEWTAGIRVQKPGNDGRKPNQPYDPNQPYQPYEPWLPTAAATKDGLISRLKTKDGKTIVFKKRPNYSPARDLSRIAQAESRQMVKTAMSGIRASIYQLKASGGEKGAVKQLVGQAEQVLSKARVKIKNLEKEGLLRSAQKRAEQEDHIARAAHLKRTLEEHRVKRRVREFTQIRDYYPTPQEIEREEERAGEWAAQVTGDLIGSGGSGGLASYLPSGSAVPVGTADAPGGNGIPGTGVFINITL